MRSALSHLAFAEALLTKQTALFALSILAALGVAAHLRARHRSVANSTAAKETRILDQPYALYRLPEALR